MKQMALLALLFVMSCSSTSSKLTKHDAGGTSNRIVFGRLIDLNEQSDKNELQITYTLSEFPANTILGFDNKFPRLDTKANYFWIPIPKESNYFGVRSIRFKHNGVDATAIIRDEKNGKALFGMTIKPGLEPIYIGDITIRSGMRKFGAGLEAEGYDVKEISIKNNALAAKDFLIKNEIDSQNLVINTFNFKKRY